MSHSRSFAKSLLAAIVVTVRKSFWFSVTLVDEFMGVLNLLSRFPQYLITAMFVGALHVSISLGSAMALSILSNVWFEVRTRMQSKNSHEGSRVTRPGEFASSAESLR